MIDPDRSCGNAEVQQVVAPDLSPSAHCRRSARAPDPVGPGHWVARGVAMLGRENYGKTMGMGQVTYEIVATGGMNIHTSYDLGYLVSKGFDL